MSQKPDKKVKKILYNKKKLRNKILGFFSNNKSKSYNYKQISRRLEIKDDTSRQLVSEVLRELEANKTLTEISAGKYKLRSKGGYIIGKADFTIYGDAWIISDDIGDDIYINRSNLKHALHDDIVKVYLFAGKSARRLEGQITEIISRPEKLYTGVLEISGDNAFLICDNKKMPYDLFISGNKLKDAKNGNKVSARILDWPDSAKNPFGEIVDVFGEPGVNETEMHAILTEYGFPYKFNKEVEKIAEKIEDKIDRGEYLKRKDFRKTTTFTIDPEDAKDFDDALSVKKLRNNNWEIGIHIADVTHYVKENSAIDKEAYQRATSVYLVDRVVPMLPECLSNKICSLRPNEEKLCFSVVFEIDNNSKIIDVWCGKSVILSDRRFNYHEAQDIIESGVGDFSEEIILLNKLAEDFRKQRFDKGSFAFAREEVKFKLDNKNVPISVYFKEAKEANWLVEEFMLLANKYVAEKIAGPNKKSDRKTFVYRIHDEPDKEKLADFSNLARKFGYSIQTDHQQQLSKSINKLLLDISGKAEQNMLETIAIRTMAKAVYSTNNIGHYGLGFKHYTHFTSPIRRYPDMIVHRLLYKYLLDGKNVDAENIEKQCEHCSNMEDKATSAERASVKYKQLEFLIDKVGKQFSGLISGVSEWGIYVEIIENKCEGMVPMRELDDDFYELDKKNYCIIGKRTNKKYTLGDNVLIEIVRISMQKKQMDFRIIN
ncbi:ribonuclease R [Bacteroidota bacterium]